jgi:solute carrier family 25 phosphate transporter 3
MMQGFCKFGFYDLIKSRIYAFVNDDDLAMRWRLPILLGASGLAEVIASWALTPMEVTRIYMVMNPQVNKGMLSAMKQIVKNDGIKGFFKGLPLIMVRQVPYTCAKLAGYDLISERIKAVALSLEERRQASLKPSPSTKKSALKKVVVLSGVQQAAIQLGSGIMAGVLAACISQPADVLLSKVCGGAHALSECIIIGGPMDLIHTFQEMGWKQCYAGLQPRAVMVGTLTAMQFLLYEQTKAKVMAFKFERPTLPKITAKEK